MDEHQTMTSCKCAESDRLLCLCISCGRVSVDPSWCFIGFAVFFFAAQAARFLL